VASSSLATRPVAMVVAGSCLVTRPMIIAVLTTPQDPITHPHHMTLQAKRVLALANNIIRRQVARNMLINHKPHTSTVRLFRVLTGVTQKPTSVIITRLARDPTPLPVALTTRTQDPMPLTMHFLRTLHLETAHILHHQVPGHMLTPHNRWTMTSGSLAPRLVVLDLVTTGTKNTHRTRCLKNDNMLPHRMSGEILIPKSHVSLQHKPVVVTCRPTHRTRYPCLTFK